MKREYSYLITIAFILFDLVVSVLTQLNVISNLAGIMIGIFLIAALIILTRVTRGINLRRARVAISFFMALFLSLMFTSLAV
ncbi:hypothetical protein FC72_GL000070 [Companilactobacillus tucceti DSM 20183]|uniref:Uncharacterized protein n=1 Tax=Companilactobacillus tucceti DSM 20183 TaxID=1423811 RepID=A0A0R1J350_9LACO|nr:hypothetical protein [Companilactobacillus tucceti]KRK65628.1 hypothetical protein FC72_GL000070 [Companilactobacillus tucceti DSM 20183]